MTEFKAPEDTSKYQYEDVGSEPPESLGDRFGEFVPESPRQAAAVDAQPSHEDLLLRQPREELTEDEKAAGREQAEKANRELGFYK